MYHDSPSQGCFGVHKFHYLCSGQARQTSAANSVNRKISTVYAPIYSYRVVDFAQSTSPCLNGGNTQPPSLMCTFPSGYQRIQVLCHGGATYSSTPVWVDAWLPPSYAPAPGVLLQVPHETEQSVIYNSSNDTYVGNIPTDYDWLYFRFVPYDNPSPKTTCTFNVYDRPGTKIFTNTRDECPLYRTLGCSDDPKISNGSFGLPPGHMVVSFSGLSANADKLSSYISSIPTSLTNAIASNQKNQLQVWEVGQGFASSKLSVTSEGDCPVPKLRVDFLSLCPQGTCEVECDGHTCCYDSNGRAV